MDALIIAAGAGSRLRPVADPKPLAPILDLPLIEIGVRQAARAGAGRVVVVTGYRADVIEAALPAIASRAGIAVVPQRVDDWRLPNGHSVIAGASLIDGDYLLMMADHIFADPILPDLVAKGAPNGGVTLAIDRRTKGSLIDPDDATWVELDNRGLIRAIGKDIASYHAVDCGAMDIGESWWIDVDDPRAYALAQAQVAARLSHLFDAARLPFAKAYEETLAG